MALCYFSYLHDGMSFLSLLGRETMSLHGRSLHGRPPPAPPPAPRPTSKLNLGETLIMFMHSITVSRNLKHNSVATVERNQPSPTWTLHETVLFSICVMITCEIWLSSFYCWKHFSTFLFLQEMLSSWSQTECSCYGPLHDLTAEEVNPFLVWQSLTLSC